MNVPDLIPICYEPGYRTSTVGHWSRGQFFGSVVGVFAGGGLDDDTRWLKRWYAVLHEFDKAGRYVDSTIEATGTVGKGLDQRIAVEAARNLLREWVDGLPGRTFGDIAIAPFSVTFEGTLFGLVHECHGEYPDGEELDDWAEFYPDRLGFGPPWDGSYDT